MSFHDHEPEEYNKRFGVKQRLQKGTQQPLPDEFTEERIGSFVKVYETANRLNLNDFLLWCKDNDYYFEKPIKTPIIKPKP
jgi:hypothetical protein